MRTICNDFHNVWMITLVKGCSCTSHMRCDVISMALKKLSCFKENTKCICFENVHKKNLKIKEKISTLNMICMLVENRSFHPVLYFRKQPKRGVPKKLRIWTLFK